MKVPVRWLNTCLDKPLLARQMAEAMERAGIEIEEVVEAEPLDSKVVIGRVLEVADHPNADKLRLAQVDVGGTTLGIVCGAPNLAVDQMVVVAQVGATLPDGTDIKKAAIRGHQSEGMICSQAELGLGSDHSGILVVTGDAKVGQLASEVYPAQAVIDVTTAANRWDLTSIVGIAREVAAHGKRRLVAPEPKVVTPEASQKPSITATVVNPQNVSRYMLASLSVDVSATTPQWMRANLQAAGIRPISIVVDITNYVLLEQGQPLHALNADSITGPISVRNAKTAETITTLDGKQRKLVADDVVIADETMILALAGVMGGKDSEVGPVTKRIILESASFHPGKLRRTAVRYSLRTEASARFERGVPVDATAIGLRRAIELLQEYAGARLLAEPTDIISRPPAKTVIATTIGGIQALLGLVLKPAGVVEDLARLSMTAKLGSRAGDITVSVPWWRPDVVHSADIAEEIMKLVGYDALPATLPAWQPQQINFDNTWSRLWQAKAVLRSVGLFEVVTYSFIGEQQITELGWDPTQYLELENPLSSEQKYLRAELLPSLLAATVKNRRYATQFGLFEFSKVFHKRKKGELPDEPTVLGALFVASSEGYRSAKQLLDRLGREFNVDLVVSPKPFDPVVSHPTQSAAIEVDGEHIGSIFSLHPTLVNKLKMRGEMSYLEINWNKFRAGLVTKRYLQTSKYPSIWRDVSILVDGHTPWSAVAAGVSMAPPLVAVDYVRDYYGDDVPVGKKVITIRLEFAVLDRTLTDPEADAAVAQVISGLHKAVGAVVRE